MSFWEKLSKLPRFWIYLGLLIVMILPIVLKIKAHPKMGLETRLVYDYIDHMKPGSVLLMNFTYGPSSMPELHPMAKAVMRHALLRGVKVVGMSLNIEGTGLGLDVFNSVANEFKKAGHPLQYGKDYVYLGYKTGYAMVIRGIGGDFHETFPVDYFGHSTSDEETMPLTARIHNYDDIDLVIDFSASGSGATWITYAYQQFNQKIAIGITAVMGADYQQYIRTGQLVGLLNGMKAAADYEAAVAKLMEKELHYTPPPYATVGITAVTWAQLYLILMVIVGNLAFFMIRKQQRRRR